MRAEHEQIPTNLKIMIMDLDIHYAEFDRYGRFIESPCFGCELTDCSLCLREKSEL